jgi:hypothetical protein
MKIDHLNVDIFSGILIVTSKKNVTLDDLKEVHEIMEDSLSRTYNYGIYQDIIGYFDGYDFKKNISIYCGTLNETKALEKIINYRDEQIKNNGN